MIEKVITEGNNQSLNRKYIKPEEIEGLLRITIDLKSNKIKTTFQEIKFRRKPLQIVFIFS